MGDTTLKTQPIQGAAIAMFARHNNLLNTDLDCQAIAVVIGGVRLFTLGRSLNV